MDVIREIKETLDGSLHIFRCQPVDIKTDRAVVCYRHEKEQQVADVQLPADTVSLGYFWTNRNYNVYHWLTPQVSTVGFYINISDNTRITSSKICWRDLVVDVLLTPDGRCRVLDEDELPRDIEPQLLKKIETTRDDILADRQQLMVAIEEQTTQYWDLC